MTALNWALTDQEVVIANDTLVADGHTHEPIGFSNKVHLIPHAKTIVAGTGIAQLISSVAFQVSCSSICRDVADVARNLPHLIRTLANQIEENVFTTTIYVFGWSEDHRRMSGFAHRSTSDFRTEELQHGLGIKPLVSVDAQSISDFESFFLNLIIRQRSHEDAKLSSEVGKVDIGGEIILTHLTQEHCCFRKIYRFADYVDMFNLAIARTRM
jgi:hypothetical protein